MNFREPPSTLSRRAAAVVDITALVDVVFQLLIFFLLTSSYVSSQQNNAPKIDVDLPESSPNAESTPSKGLIITVDAAGGVFIDDDPVSMEELGVRLVKAANKNANTVVLIRGDKTVPYGRIAEVMSVARTSRLRISAVLRGGE